jgi:hypothetical protein
VALAALAGGPVVADPCGMVPPISVQDPNPIARVGDQVTYVFFKDGVETFVIRPGFTGKADEFGMLIPFPVPPAIRKVADSIFPHVAAAIDPPEVVVDLRWRYRKALAAAREQDRNRDGLEIQRGADEVRVIREEAVGMYEVAVLDAGSAAALKRWMEDHKYRYPTGMDKVCDEYVAAGWCFVAVKTRVGHKAGVDPQPGMREVNGRMPSGATFDGHVQAMGFRFEVDQLVVPMRLGAYNEGELHNIVYLLTDGPRRIRSIPEEYVVRQINGRDLFRNVTQPLPLRIIGGTEADIPAAMRQQLESQRDPAPRNGFARELFASDLLAVQKRRLSHPFEEAEKMLLRIGEHLSLRGPEIDQLNGQSLAEQRQREIGDALEALKDMTLTVIDGDFPREVLAGQNLAFAEYRMPARRNSPEFYDANTKQPAPRREGVLILGALRTAPHDRSTMLGSRATWWTAAGGTLFAALLVCGARRRPGTAAVVLLAVAVTLALCGSAAAQQAAPTEKEILALIDQLEDAEKADAAVAQLIKIGAPAVPHLLGEALEGDSIIRRGWSIVCLAEIGGADVEQRLTELHNDEKQPMLVRTWAAAARVHRATKVDDLVALANLVGQFPALGRPVGLKLVAALSDPNKPATVEDVLAVSQRVPQLQQSLAPAILAFGSEKLLETMVGAKDNNVRNLAAAYLGTLAQQGDKSVAPGIVKVYRFDPQAKQVPWQGGALWIPGIQWNEFQKDARELVRSLMAWYLWTELKNQRPQQQQIHNNLNSIQLAQAAGYQIVGFVQNVKVEDWLLRWGQAAGRDELQKLLAEQGVEKEQRWARLLEQLQ